MTLIHTNDRIFIAGSRGMAGKAIVRALKRGNYGNKDHGGALLTPCREELDLLDDVAVTTWMHINKPDVVILAAATVGGIEANRSTHRFSPQKSTYRTSCNRSSMESWRKKTIILRKQLHISKVLPTTNIRRVFTNRIIRTNK